jgi:hypothetical protein
MRHFARAEIVAHRRPGLGPVHIVGLHRPHARALRCQ